MMSGILQKKIGLVTWLQDEIGKLNVFKKCYLV